MVKRRRRKKAKKLSAQERQKLKIQRAHVSEIRSTFKAIGFSRVSSACVKEFTYLGTTSDFDDVFLSENILALVEYTTAQESGISDHLKKKKVLYDKILRDPESFIDFMDATFPDFTKQRGTYYSPQHFRIAIVYCSLNNVKKALKTEVPGLRYLDFHIAKYFKAITSIVKLSARFEFYRFLGFDHDDVGLNVISTSTAASTNYKGSILPEAHSNFGKGHKVVSFYADPEALLSRCYVLRKDGWENGNLYQRMISRKKIEAIRRYLLQQKRVFINNIIVTLPSNTKLINAEGDTQDISQISKTAPVEIQLPSQYNSIGLIDGQHRVFSYYEDKNNAQEATIKRLRTQQNLLVTGIIYPAHVSASEKTKFEAMLFLEINATQTNAKSDIKQAIGLMLRPFSSESIAKEIVNHLNDDGPLANQFERFFFDKKKLKTTSVVSYGIRPLVKLQGSDTLYRVWRHANKADLVCETNSDARAAYIEFCAKQINLFISAFRVSLPTGRWTADKLVPGRLLTTTNINGFIVCLRKILENDKLHTFEFYRDKLIDISKFSFNKYRSSQYGSMGEDLYNRYFT